MVDSTGGAAEETVKEVGKQRVVSPGFSDADLPVVDSELFGRLWAPRTLSEFTALAEGELAAQPLGGWRGQARANWALHSAAVRRLESQARGWLLTGEDVTEAVVRSYEERLLQKARLAGHGHPPNGRRLADLELLGVLQHHGAATRLVDFTFNALIALWFACRSHLSIYGVVVGVALDDAMRIETEPALERDLATVLGEAEGRMTFWQPSALSPRMPAQHAFLLWSDVQPRDWSSLGTDAAEVPAEPAVSELSSEFAAIAISPRLKEFMKPRWQELLGYGEETMFPDLDGFANAHGAVQELAWDFML
jgi:hypothetical protein